MADIVAIVVLVAVVALAVRSLRRDKGCGSSCADCGGSCASCAFPYQEIEDRLAEVGRLD